MQNSTSITPPDNIDTPDKSAFISAEQGTLDIVELMNVAERLNSAGRKDSTISLYRLWLEHTVSPLAYVAWFNLGVVLAAGGEHLQADAMYRNALDLNPDLLQARLNLGNCLEQQKREDDALDQWRIVAYSKNIDLPENRKFQLHALNNLGRLLEIKKQYQASLEMLEKSFSVDPTQRDVLIHLVHLTQKICRWPVYNPPKGTTKLEMLKYTSPLAMLAVSDDPALQLSAAKHFVEHKYAVQNTEELAPKEGYSHKKIRIGYLSSDFCLHAVSLLTVELLELHDHNQFEVYGFSWSREDGSALRKRVINAMDHYIRIDSMSDKEAADCIRSHEIDIIIDLQGLTSGARPLILSHRPAVVQMTYLGFPGATGLPWIDYVIADKFLIPNELIPHHTEKPLYMPNCFQSSDSKREVGEMPSRAANDLPENAFVFCVFNNNYKFTPELFASWMRIIKRVPGSVLWLLEDNEWARKNLSQAAKKHGLKKGRLIFASRVAPADYLARYQLADLFLDTFPFNGGTTANDALFMGLPLLTLSGRTFASRMAGSLLTHLGLPELITTDLKEYEEKAVWLAKKPVELNTIKSRLIENKALGAVFNIGRFVKDYENAIAETLMPGASEKVQLKLSKNHDARSHFSVMPGSSRLKVYCIGHTKPTFEPPVEFQILCPQSLGMPGEIIIDDNRFGSAIDGVCLAEYSQLFGLYEMLSAGDVVTDNLYLFQYRKFVSTNRGGVPANAPWVRIVNSQEAHLIFPTFEQITSLTSRILVGELQGLGESTASNYARVHVIDDFVLFCAACLKCGSLSETDLMAFTTFLGIIPSPALCYIHVELFVELMKILKSVWAEFSRHYHIKREGYQRRVAGYLLERLHSYLLIKYLNEGKERIDVCQRYVVS